MSFFNLYVFDLSPKITISAVKPKGSIVPIKNDFKALDPPKKEVEDINGMHI